jgi:hypothetical protein
VPRRRISENEAFPTEPPDCPQCHLGILLVPLGASVRALHHAV